MTVETFVKYYFSAYWLNFESSFSEANIQLKPVYPELVDLVWLNRPPQINVPISHLPEKFSGT